MYQLEGVKFLWVTESFRQFCAPVSLANIFRWKILAKG